MAYGALYCEILTAVDGSADGNELLDAALGAEGLEAYDLQCVDIFVHRKFIPGFRKYINLVGTEVIDLPVHSDP